MLQAVSPKELPSVKSSQGSVKWIAEPGEEKQERDSPAGGEPHTLKNPSHLTLNPRPQSDFSGCKHRLKIEMERHRL